MIIKLNVCEHEILPFERYINTENIVYFEASSVCVFTKSSAFDEKGEWKYGDFYDKSGAMIQTTTGTFFVSDTVGEICDKINLK